MALVGKITAPFHPGATPELPIKASAAGSPFVPWDGAAGAEAAEGQRGQRPSGCSLGPLRNPPGSVRHWRVPPLSLCRGEKPPWRPLFDLPALPKSHASTYKVNPSVTSY